MRNRTSQQQKAALMPACSCMQLCLGRSREVERFVSYLFFCFFVGFVFGNTGSRVGHFCANEPRKSHCRNNEVN